MKDSSKITADGFSLDRRLAADCHILGRSTECDLLLMNNLQFRPWFILVPHTQEHELIDLESGQLQRVMQQLGTITRFMRTEYRPDKINTATIGNMVSQLHIHIVARYYADPCWPSTVWGDTGNKLKYTSTEVETIRTRLIAYTTLFSS